MQKLILTKLFVILLVCGSSRSFAMPIPLTIPTPEELFPLEVTKSNICEILWRVPFASNVRLVDRIRTMEQCDHLEYIKLLERQSQPESDPN